MDEVPWLTDELDGWQAAITAWAGEQVRAAGLGAGVEVVSSRLRPWSALLAVRTDGGRPLWCKAVEPRRRSEVAVTVALAERWPALAPDVLAVDEGRSWLLLGDHGTAVADDQPAARQIELVADLLPAYAEMQAATVDRLGGWIALGVPDRRVARLPDLFAAVLVAAGDDLRARCEPGLPAVAAAVEQLADAPVPAAGLDHADVHGWNVLFDGRRPRLVDWGDCCVTHPFSSLFVPDRFLVAALPAADRPAAWARLRDAYLEPWGGPTSEHLEVLRLAMWLGPIVRVLSLADEADGDAEIRDLLGDWPLAP